MRKTAVAVAGALILAACGPDVPDAGIEVVVTTNVLGNVVSQIAGPDARVEVLVPIGIDPHDYQPSARQAADIQQADLVIANGLGLEEGLTDVLGSAVSDGANVIEIAPLLDPIPFASLENEDEEHLEGEEDEEEHAHGDLDPHVWLDPIRMQQAARVIAEALADIDPSIDWMERADAYGAELATADAQISGLLADIPGGSRLLVTNHDALGYFADRYDFEIVGTVIPRGSTLADPSSLELAALVDLIEERGVRAIFAETTEPSALAEAVAAEVGSSIEVTELYTGSLGEPGSGAETLIGLLLTNAKRIADALMP